MWQWDTTHILAAWAVFTGICSIVAPLVQPWSPRVGAALHSIASMGADVAKLLQSARAAFVGSPTVPKAPPGPGTAALLILAGAFAAGGAGRLAIGCTPASRQFPETVTGSSIVRDPAPCLAVLRLAKVAPQPGQDACAVADALIVSADAAMRAADAIQAAQAVAASIATDGGK